MILSKKLFKALGPLLVATVILAGLLISPFELSHVSSKTIEKSATSMAPNVLKGSRIKNEAVADGKFVPFFGSSELSRFDPYHPVTMAEKYQRPYQLFLLGYPGTQSLTHYFILNSMREEMRGKKAVFFISPQWFVKNGVQTETFAVFYSPLQTYDWAANAGIDAKDQYAAKRLQDFPSTQKDLKLSRGLQDIAKGEKVPKRIDRKYKVKSRTLKREDDIFGTRFIKSKRNKIDKEKKLLPEQYDVNKLDKEAYDLAKKRSSNNEFQIANKFYSTRVAPTKSLLKDSQKKFDYEFSPEFSDFQLFLNECADLDMDVLFVIPPVNKKWSDYTGLSTKMLENFDKKINYQLRSQGFNNILDLSGDAGVDYFMSDTIHIGYRGWLRVDEVINPFLQTIKAKPQSYKMNNKFYQKEWQNRSAADLPDMRKLDKFPR